MFGDLMGNLEQQQEAMAAKLASIEVDVSVGDGAIKIKANAAREILNLSIDKSKIDLNDTEELEDLLLVAFNRVVDEASAVEAEETEKSIKDILPPGMGGLSNLFG